MSAVDPKADDAPASPARETVVWWGCELRAPPASAASPRGPGVWELHYDAHALFPRVVAK